MEKCTGDHSGAFFAAQSDGRTVFDICLENAGCHGVIFLFQVIQDSLVQDIPVSEDGSLPFFGTLLGVKTGLDRHSLFELLISIGIIIA